MVSADIVLTGNNGVKLQEWIDVKISKFPMEISVADIENCDSGTIKVIWHLSDGSSTEQSQNTVFKKQ